LIQLLHRFLEYRSIFIPILVVIIGGVFGGFIAAAGLALLTLLFSKKNRLEFLFALVILTFFLADNFRGPFAYMQNFRFVMLGVSILYLLKYKLIQNNSANYLILFTIVASVVTLLFSPLGTVALLRAFAFWLVALVIFKLANLLYLSNNKRASELLVLILALYFGLNLILVFLPILDVYLIGRFKGLAGNPNGFALIAMFGYAILLLIEKRKETTFKATFFLVFKILLFILVFLTGSRTALFSMIVFECFLRLINNKPLLLISLSGLAFLYVLVNNIGSDALIGYLGFSDYLRVESLVSASGRTEVWPVAWEEIKNAPWLGNGIMYDNYFMSDYVEKYIGEGGGRQWGGVWSSYLSLLLDVGVIGCIAYAYFWVQVFRKSHYKNIAIAFIMMCLLSGVTESWMAASMNAFTPLMFLFWAIQSQPATNK
jgi:hypothetical protein